MLPGRGGWVWIPVWQPDLSPKGLALGRPAHKKISAKPPVNQAKSDRRTSISPSGSRVAAGGLPWHRSKRLNQYLPSRPGSAEVPWQTCPAATPAKPQAKPVRRSKALALAWLALPRLQRVALGWVPALKHVSSLR